MRKTLGIFWLLILVIGAWGVAWADEVQTNDEEPSVFIDDVGIMGLRANLRDEEILSILDYVKPKSVVTRSMVLHDARKILDLGFFRNVAVDVTEDESGIHLWFQVVTNPVIYETRIEGLDSTAWRLVGENLSFPSEPYVLNVHEMNERAQQARDWFVAHGYPLGRMVGYHVPEEGVLVVEMDLGTVGRVVLEGVTDRERSLILAKMPYRVGSVLTEDSLRDSIRWMRTLPGIAEVSVRFEEIDNEVVAIFNVETKPTGEYQIGVGYNTKDGFLGFGEIKDTDFLNTWREVGAGFRISQRTRTFRIRYSDPHLCTCWDRLTLEGHYDDGRVMRQGQQIYERNVGGNIAIEKELTRQLTSRIGLDFKHVTDDLHLSDGRIVTLQAGLKHRSDHHRASIQTDWSSRVLGSEWDFLKLHGSYSTRWNVGPGDVLAGVQMGVSALGEVPPVEQYRVGGFGTLRGFPYGYAEGRTMLATTVEYEIPIYGIISGLVFVDVANAWSGTIPSLLSSWGIGGRVDTPIGQIELDVATNEHGQPKVVFGIGAQW